MDDVQKRFCPRLFQRPIAAVPCSPAGADSLPPRLLIPISGNRSPTVTAKQVDRRQNIFCSGVVGAPGLEFDAIFRGGTTRPRNAFSLRRAAAPSPPSARANKPGLPGFL